MLIKKNKKKIVVISGSTGGGHVRAALSLKRYGERFFNEYEFIHIDIVEHMSKLFKKMYADAYINIINNFPKLFGFLYDNTDVSTEEKGKYILHKARYFIEEFFALRFKKTISKIDPSYIIFTHFLPAEHMNKSKYKYADRYAVVVTDYDVHWLWVQKNMDKFFVASEEAALKLEKRGIERSKIEVTGIPIDIGFIKKYDKKSIRKRLRFDPETKTVIIMSGAFGVGYIDSLVELILSKIDLNFQIIVMTGKNRELYKRINYIAKQYPYRVRAIKFTSYIEKFMAASDFAITKTGGLTTSECLAMGLPIITFNPIPGQEDRNCNFILEKGAGFRAFDNEGLLYRITTLLEDNILLNKMQKNAKMISKPYAAFNIIDKLVNDGMSPNS